MSTGSRRLGGGHGRGCGEEGQTTLMIIGFAVIVLLVVTVVANASAAFLVRRSLSSWADGAAVVAAQSVAEEAVYTGEMGDVLPLSQASARESVGAFVARHGLAGRFQAFRVDGVAVRADGAVTVTLGTRMPLVLVNDVVPGRSVPVVASATALAPLS
jgi:hypothetical protein